MKLSIAVSILAVAIGMIGINARSYQRQREYDRHVEAADRDKLMKQNRHARRQSMITKLLPPKRLRQQEQDRQEIIDS